MKYFFALFLLLATTTGAFGAERVSVNMPIKSQIINLATMPVEEAIAFCDRRAMKCPAIRVKYEAKYGSDTPIRKASLTLVKGKEVFE